MDGESDNESHPQQFWFTLRILDELELRYLGSGDVPDAWVHFSDLQSLALQVRHMYGYNFTDDEIRRAGEEAIQMFYEDNPEAMDILSNASTRRTSRTSIMDIVDDIVDSVTSIVALGVQWMHDDPAPQN
jgi:hypothetical protein